MWMPAKHERRRENVRGKMAALIVSACLILAASVPPVPAQASVFDEIGKGLVTVTGLRGAIQQIGASASQGVREQLARFVDEKVDPLLARVDQILANRIGNAEQAALRSITALEHVMNQIIDRAATQMSSLNAEFFQQLDATLDATFRNLDSLVDKIVCALAPAGTGEISVVLAPFGGHNRITVRRPLHTHCYRWFLTAHDDPAEATYEGWEFFAGELCEYELKLGRIEPNEPRSIQRAIAGYDKLAAMANSARCAAPTPAANAEMVQKLLLYQSRASFLRRISRKE
jgi:hypothetical protein